MYSHVAARAFTAGLEAQSPVGHASLIVKAGMTLQAKLATFAAYQQHAISAAVRCMAGGASFHLY